MTISLHPVSVSGAIVNILQLCDCKLEAIRHDVNDKSILC